MKGDEGIDRVHFAWLSPIEQTEEELECALNNIREMSVHEPGEPETLRKPEISEANSKRGIDPDLARKNNKADDAPGIRSRWISFTQP